VLKKMDLDIAGYKILNLSPMNVLMGKNGCGKSRMLRAIERAMVRSPDFPHARYLSPERGGNLEYNPGIEQSMNSNAQWLADTRRANRAEQFRLQSVTQFRKLEILTLRNIERNSNLRLDLDYTFDTIVGQINEILYNIRIERAESGFEFLVRDSEEKLEPAEISSGEAEIVSLAIEVLVFEKEVEGKENCYLLMDEPDLHIHPDLQTKFARFLSAATNRAGFTVIIATHSTAFLGALADNKDTSVEFMRGGETELSFEQVTRIHRAVLPVFGAHPLSSVFNEAPPLLVG
jgi:predicted ATP-dependent endonuclease of OLD family